MTGIGEGLQDVPNLPPLQAVLVNPRVPVPTGPVFQGLASKTNPPMGAVPDLASPGAVIDWLADRRNDLEAPARLLQPVIGDVLDALRRTGARLARMSGSGATCFGLYPDADAAQRAAQGLSRDRPGWWITATTLT